jgi:hypothetical protein
MMTRSDDETTGRLKRPLLTENESYTVYSMRRAQLTTAKRTISHNRGPAEEWMFGRSCLINWGIRLDNPAPA